jgi:phosphatidylserine/phosphatidylglycerophosphate/cardiolipin synthase-like enzyme
VDAPKGSFMTRRRTTSRSRSRRRAAPQQNLQSLIIVLAIVGLVWLYQNGYFDRLLGAVGIDPPRIELPEGGAPETVDGDEPAPPIAVGSAPAQPAAPPVDAPPPQQTIETQTLRGAAGDWYQIYFSRPQYPEGAAGRVGGLDETLAADIDRAQARVDLASFDLDLPRVTDALIRAHERGVQVRVVADGENLEDPDVAMLTGELQNAGIPVFFDEREAFMHNKFIVIDGATVWTGSWNLTTNDTFRNNNNMLRIVNRELAANYTAKADDLFSGEGGTAGGSVLIYPTLQIGGATVVNMFAPDDPITNAIVERIDNAQQQIQVMAFAFTSDPVADALIAARDRGVAVRVVMESRNVRGTGSEFNKLLDAGIEILPDGNCYIMHHKAIVIDGRTVITGSFNFTRSAQEQNDENVLIVDDASLAARFGEEWGRVYDQAREPTACGRS